MTSASASHSNPDHAPRKEPQLASLHRSVAVSFTSDDDKVGTSPKDSHLIILKVVYDPVRIQQHADGEKAAHKQKIPVVLFLSGADCSHESYMWLASRLVQEGFCVALSSYVQPFGASTVLLSVPMDLRMMQTLQDYQKGPSNAGIAAILDELASLNNDHSSILAGKLDLDRIIVGGHSTGGRTVLDLVAYDNPFPIAAAFTYGASLVNTGGFGFAEPNSVLPPSRRRTTTTKTTITPPLLMLGGSEDGISARLSKRTPMMPRKRCNAPSTNAFAKQMLTPICSFSQAPITWSFATRWIPPVAPCPGIDL